MIRREELLDVLRAGLELADPLGPTRDAAGRLPQGDVVLVAFGKAAYRMSLGALEALGERVVDGIVIVPKGSPSGRLPRLEVVEGTHPLPSEQNVRASERAREIVRGVREDQLLLALISGGGSSLLEIPRGGLGVEYLAALTGELMRRGADVRELNVVRKHLSEVKGGQLLRGFRGRACFSLIVSDVVGNPVEAIASGPTAPDPTTYSDALRIMDRYGLSGEFPEAYELLRAGAMGRLPETLKPGDPIFERVRNEVILDNRPALSAMRRRASSMGFRAEVLTESMEGEAREVGRFLGSLSTGEPGRALCAGGETTVTVRGKGVGGRNQEIVLGAALQVRRLGTWARAGVGALATDGVDGNSPAAGAALGSEELSGIDEEGIREALRENDSYNFLRRLGATIEIGPTGTNVNDLFIMLLRE